MNRWPRLAISHLSTPGPKLYKTIATKQERGEIDTLEKLCNELCSLPLLFQPGSDYAYGMSLDVLGHVMQLATGKPLRRIIQSRVLEPVGMRDSCFLVPASKLHQLATYYRLMRDPVKGKRWLQRLDGSKARDSMYAKGSRAVYRSLGVPTGVPAGGGLWGAGRSTMLFSLRDILLYCQMLLNSGRSVSGRRVLKESTVRSLQTDWLRLKRASKIRDPPGWGSPDVGWSPLGNIERYGPHAGALYMGGMSYFWLDPARKIAAAIMTETYWQVNPLGWKEDMDDLDQVLQHAAKARVKRRQSGGQSPQKRKKMT
ncbi:unnamed protein product [Durusdinium trenchii]|uniref:Beta-lactamase-related domain-containing protein n=1 Tax=Durusdinium trenchii TaxID=1381693 RepID=A0ABP0QDY4_9DINO